MYCSSDALCEGAEPEPGGWCGAESELMLCKSRNVIQINYQSSLPATNEKFLDYYHNILYTDVLQPSLLLQ